MEMWEDCAVFEESDVAHLEDFSLESMDKIIDPSPLLIPNWQSKLLPPSTVT
jgi:hypothetical protein